MDQAGSWTEIGKKTELRASQSSGSGVFIIRFCGEAEWKIFIFQPKWVYFRSTVLRISRNLSGINILILEFGGAGAKQIFVDFEGMRSKKMRLCPRPVTGLRHQEGRRYFWEGPKIFELCPIFSNYIQHIFPGRANNFLRGGSPPLVTGLLCPTSGVEPIEAAENFWGFYTSWYGQDNLSERNQVKEIIW